MCGDLRFADPLFCAICNLLTQISCGLTTSTNLHILYFSAYKYIGIPIVCFFFCSTELNSELFSLLRKGLERNSESFLFRGTAGIPLEITICSVYSVFRGIIFLSEIPNPSTKLYKVKTADSCCHSLSTGNYIPLLSLLKGLPRPPPPPHTHK